MIHTIGAMHMVVELAVEKERETAMMVCSTLVHEANIRHNQRAQR
jgi:hypothetical protein